ncbi:MAG: hypothetical protein ACU0CI_00820 [Shimia sp.]
MFRVWFSLIIAIIVPGPATAQDWYSGFVPVAYSDIAFSRIETFEDLEPPVGERRVFEMALTRRGFTIGEHFLGQRVVDRLSGEVVSGIALAPLRLGRSRNQTYVTAYMPNDSARILGTTLGGTRSIEEWARHDYTLSERSRFGEGVVAFLFDAPLREVGMVIHHARDEETTRRGEVRVQAFDHSGREVATARIVLPDAGAFYPIGLRLSDQTRTFSGLSLMNTDPGGVSYDNIKFTMLAPGM